MHVLLLEMCFTWLLGHESHAYEMLKVAMCLLYYSIHSVYVLELCDTIKL